MQASLKLKLTGAGGDVPTEIKVHARHTDNSIKFAQVIARITTAGYYDLNEVDVADPSPLARVVPGAKVNVVIGGVTWTAEPAAAAAVDDWFAGAKARETRYWVNFKRAVTPFDDHPTLKCAIDVRNYDDGSWWASFAVENTLNSSSAGGVNLTSLTVLRDTEVIHSIGSRFFPYCTRVRFQVASSNYVASEITPDLEQFYTSKLFPRFAMDVPYKLDAVGYDPFSSGSHDLYEPGHSGRPELAPLPAYVARYLVHKDPKQRRVVLEQGDLAGNRPMHIRKANGAWEILDADNADNRRWISFGDDSGWPLGNRGQRGDWHPDVAHQPSFGFAQFLLTGERYYAEELSVHAQGAALSTHPDWRDGTAGNGRGFGELRAVAWYVARTAEANAALPDGWPGKGAAGTAGTLAHFCKNTMDYMDTASQFEPPQVIPPPSPLGAVMIDWRPENTLKGYENHYWVAPWEQQFLTWAVRRAHNLGYNTTGVNFLARSGNLMVGIANQKDFRANGGYPYILAVCERTEKKITLWYSTFDMLFPGTFKGWNGPAGRLSLIACVEAGVPNAQNALTWYASQQYVLDECVGWWGVGWYIDAI